MIFDIISFKKIQEQHFIVPNSKGASTLRGKAQFTTIAQGNFIEGTPVAHDFDRSEPAAAMAVVMRPGLPPSTNLNDFDFSLGHVNVKVLTETIRQLGMKLTGIQGYCDGCAEDIAIKRAVPKVVDPFYKSSRPFHCIFMDLAGPFPSSTGGAKYLLEVVDDNTNFERAVFLSDKQHAAVMCVSSS